MKINNDLTREKMTSLIFIWLILWTLISIVVTNPFEWHADIFTSPANFVINHCAIFVQSYYLCDGFIAINVEKIYDLWCFLETYQIKLTQRCHKWLRLMQMIRISRLKLAFLFLVLQQKVDMSDCHATNLSKNRHIIAW